MTSVLKSPKKIEKYGNERTRGQIKKTVKQTHEPHSRFKWVLNEGNDGTDDVRGKIGKDHFIRSRHLMSASISYFSVMNGDGAVMNTEIVQW